MSEVNVDWQRPVYGNVKLFNEGSSSTMPHRNRFAKFVLLASLAAILWCGLVAWIDYVVIPSNLAIARETLASIEKDYKTTGDYANSLAQAKTRNDWGQPIKITVVKIGWPSKAIDVTVISPGPFGIGVASVTKIIEPQ
ncbi:MAG: hypothetical protein J0M26_18385 [Planctomycetes bacterium]|nr:hypothetical protein [Planctomycetota bacterium]